MKSYIFVAATINWQMASQLLADGQPWAGESGGFPALFASHLRAGTRDTARRIFAPEDTVGLRSANCCRQPSLPVE